MMKRKLSLWCWVGMCEHHKPALKLQRMGIYFVVGVLVLLGQLYGL
jgi:hypothetical protein